jgi:hypothetical protein
VGLTKARRRSSERFLGYGQRRDAGTPALRHAVRTAPARLTNGYGSFDAGCRRDASAPACGAHGSGSPYTTMALSTPDAGERPGRRRRRRRRRSQGGLPRPWLLRRRIPARRRRSQVGRGRNALPKTRRTLV